MTPERDITALLISWKQGAAGAADELFPLVYDELRRMAHRQLAVERDGHTLGTTGLVHEAYLKLVDQTRADWSERAQFFAIASRMMRRILIDHARQYATAKRAGARELLSLDALADGSTEGGAAWMPGAPERSAALLALDDALEELGSMDERLSRVVECRFFGGLSEEETAAALGVTSRTVRRDWVKARGWLYRALAD